jgi:membrane-bound serine protease (ClpP class)
MVEGATIGAATVVNMEGQAVPDKYQSYMRAMMRSTAEATGRDPDIAQAMVDPRIKIEGIIDTGSVLTFTASEALKNGYCEAIVEDIPDLLRKAGIEDYEIIEQDLTPVDNFIGFLINPVVSGILIMIIVAGIYFELQTPGIGFPSLAAVIAALLYFAPLYLEGLAANWEILLFIAGVGLIAVEIFALPGFGIAGVSGIVLVIAGLTLSLIGNIGFDFSPVNMNAFLKALFIVIISIFLSIIISFYVTRSLFTKNRLFGSLALETTQQSSEGYSVSETDYKVQLGKQGEAFSVLRPAGKVLIEGQVFDATAISGFINKGDQVEVVKYETGQLFVKKI